MIFGGATLTGPRYIWWNFVASSKDRIEEAKAEWRAEDWGKGRFDLPIDLLECMQGRPGQVRRPDAALAKDARSAGDEKVKREDEASQGRYRLIIDGVEAEMTYSRAGGGLIIIDHTEVPAALRGRKVGERLVRQAVEDARRDGVAIMPLCPFAKAQIARHPEWQDVLRR